MEGYPSSLRLDGQSVAKVDPSRAVVGLAERARAGRPVLTDRSRAALAKLGLAIDGDPKGADAKTPIAAINHGPTLIWLRATRALKGWPTLRALAGALDRKLAWRAPVYRRPHVDDTDDADALFAVMADTLLLRGRQDPAAALAAVPASLRLRAAVATARPVARWVQLRLRRPDRRHAIDWLERLHKAAPKLEAGLELVPHRSPFAFTPNDPMFGEQWNLARIGAAEAWDHSTGDRGVVIAVIDSGCDLTHPDLVASYDGPGHNANDPTLDGSPIVLAPSGTRDWHGTAVAGVIGATIDNRIGVAGLAGGCSLLPIAIERGSTVELGEAVRLAVAGGARVINMSVAIGSFYFERDVRPEIDAAVAAGVLVVASAGNGDASPLVMPARYAPVMAIGASDRSDRRWRDPPTGLGSHWGDSEYLGRWTGVSVMAPGFDITSTDIEGPEGFTPSAAPVGDYIYRGPGFPSPFGATSAAAPHAAAAAGLLMSRYPALSAAQVRAVLERTAEKVGGYAYADAPDYPSGSRHPEMGYGRLHAARALDFGDVMVADWPRDLGVEPSTPPGGNFFSTSDVVIRPGDDGVFDPATPEQASVIEPGRDHSVYVRVRNLGPAVARGVRVDVRATPYVGLEFHYADDWSAVDALHVRPAEVDAGPYTLAPGDSQIARFALTAAQIDEMAGWRASRWHPCLLAVATAANDVAFADAPEGRHLVMRRNNLAQRNLTVAATMRSARFPFVIGHPLNPDRRITLVVEADAAALAGRVQLRLDDASAAFPVARKAKAFGREPLKVGQVSGAKPVKAGKGRTLRIDACRTVVELWRPQPMRYAVSLEVKLPPKGQQRATIHVRQVDRLGDTIGGATLVLG